MSDDLSKVEAALKRSMVALDDWLSTYADDMCHPDQVEASRARIAKYGTLAYIADVQQQNREALASAHSDPIAKRMETLVRQMASPRWSTANNENYVEARAIVALLPEPVDADLVEARRIVADDVFHSFKNKGFSKELAQKYLSGDMDDSAYIRLALAGMKAGRALERDSREG